MTENIPAIGYIGLGLMGSNMPLRLLDAGFKVTVWNRTPEKMKPALAKGAHVGTSPVDVTRHSDIVHLCLFDIAAVEEVVFGPNGVAAGATADKIMIDHSTISPDASRAMAKRLKSETGMGWIDAPVTGGTTGAAEGNLVIMAGGDEDDIERVRPVVKHLSRRFIRMGPHGAGQVTKMCNQVAVACTYCMLAEMVTLARRSGITAERLPEALEGGFGDSGLLQARGPSMIAGDFTPVGEIATMLKDLDILDRVAAEANTALPMTALATQLFRLIDAKGHGHLDITAIVKLFENGDG